MWLTYMSRLINNAVVTAYMNIQLKYCCLWNSKLYSSYKTMNDLVTMQKHNDNRYVWVVVTRFCGNNNVSVNDDVSTDA